MDWTIGVVEKQAKLLWPSLRTIAEADAFVDRIAGRYLAHSITTSRAELALAHEAPSQINYFRSGLEIAISPSMTISEPYTFAGAIPEPASRSDDFGETQAAALFEKLFSRSARIASFVPPRDPVHARDTANSAKFMSTTIERPEVVERILPQAKAADRPSTPDKLDRSDSGWGSPAPFPGTPKPLTLPAPEVKRVAEQVIHEINRRTIARRERLGRR